MTPKHIQYVIAAVFFILGGWCVLAPQSVLDLGLRPEFRRDDLVSQVLVGCFGAQACIAGLFAATSNFTRTTFLAYGLSMVIFFVFDFYFYAVKPIFTEFILLDAAGNVIFVIMCAWGWFKLKPKA